MSKATLVLCGVQQQTLRSRSGDYGCLALAGPGMRSSRYRIIAALGLASSLVWSQPASGEVTLVNPAGIAVEASGSLVMADRSRNDGEDAIIRWDPGTGDCTVVSNGTTGTGTTLRTPQGIAVEADGNILVADAAHKSIFRVNPVTGDRTILTSSSSSSFNAPTGIIIEASGDLIVSNYGTWGLIRVDSATGARTILSDVNTGSGPALGNPCHMGLEASGTIVVADSVRRAVFRVDPVTGNRSVVSDKNTGTGPDIVDPWSVIVEPSGDLVVADFRVGIYRIDGNSLRLRPG